MDASVEKPRPTLLERVSDVAVALGILAVLFLIAVPVPPPVLDALLVLNFAGSFLILVTAAYVARPLDLSSFPTVLLGITFGRLALNVATTRLILGNADQHGLHAAGEVVRAFSELVAGANLAVGFVVFSIIVLVQFVVITKGTTRISEVAARFSLDALPGKQLSIDGDLNAGAITQEQAAERRKSLEDEAGFFGAMDGAAKFVRGEAVAGIFILLINVLGGFCAGTLYYGMQMGQAAEVFTRLTVGDGLATQVPALMVSVATALLVSKASFRDSAGRAAGRQLLQGETPLFVTAAFLLLLCFTGMPVLPLSLGAILLMAAGLTLRLRRGAAVSAVSEARPAALSGHGSDARARSLLVLEPIELELGFRLIDLVDESRGGDLMARLAQVREKLAQELGLVVPAVKVQDNTRLHPAEYSIKLRGNGVGRWRVRPDRFLVLTGSDSAHGLKGSPGTDPATGRAGLWIDAVAYAAAAEAGCKLRKVSEVIAEHLESVIRLHAAEILTREEASRLLGDLRKRAPALVDELIPSTLKLGEVHKVLQALLKEQVSIRDLETILETLADRGDRTRDTAELTEYARRKLARTICASLAGKDHAIRALLLDPPLEEFLQRAVEATDRGTRLACAPEMAEAIGDAVADSAARFDGSNWNPVLICSGMIRRHIRELTQVRAPLLRVLAYEEIAPDFHLEECGAVALENALGTRS